MAKTKRPTRLSDLNLEGFTQVTPLPLAKAYRARDPFELINALESWFRQNFQPARPGSDLPIYEVREIFDLVLRRQRYPLEVVEEVANRLFRRLQFRNIAEHAKDYSKVDQWSPHGSRAFNEGGPNAGKNDPASTHREMQHNLAELKQRLATVEAMILASSGHNGGPPLDEDSIPINETERESLHYSVAVVERQPVTNPPDGGVDAEYAQATFRGKAAKIREWIAKQPENAATGVVSGAANEGGKALGRAFWDDLARWATRTGEAISAWLDSLF